MVEFALLAPAFFLLLFGVVDFGRSGYYFVTTDAIARNAARMGAAFNNGSGFLSSDIITAMTTQSQSADISSISTPAGCTAPPGGPTQSCQLPPDGQAYIWITRNVASTPHTVTVNVIYAFVPTTPMIRTITGRIYITAKSVMDMEY